MSRLRQSPREWFNNFSGVLVEIGLKRCDLDRLVFLKRGQQGTIIVGDYADDVVVTGDDNVVEPFSYSVGK